MYFAKTKKIANEYKKRLSENISGWVTQDVKLGGSTYTKDSNGNWIDKKTGESLPVGPAKIALWSLSGNAFEVEDAIYELESDLQYDDEENAKLDREAIALLKKAKVKEYEYKHKGSLYEVEVPENDMLLDENKLYSKQSNKVKEALKQFIPKGNKEALHQEILQKIYEKIGSDESNANAKEIAEYLADKVLNNFVVSPEEEYHGKKVGKLLMDFAEEYAKEKGLTSIKVDTHTKNKAMQKLCTNNGYSYRGIIYLKRDEVDNSRIAFEKVIKK